METLFAALSPVEAFIYAVLMFVVLYGTICGPLYLYHEHLRRTAPARLIQARPTTAAQRKTELFASFRSILVFGGVAVLNVWGVQHGWFGLRFDFAWPRFLAETLALFVWNEVHFFLVHRLLHFAPFYSRFHIDHHRSLVTTPFSSFSFHLVEAVLLGSVMPLAMLVHDFSIWSLFMLPVMSLLMNAAGHSNIHFSIFRFSERHADHHRLYVKNYGFFLPWMDRLLGTEARP
ncbi:MAG: sterol desaturase family protein [Bdellovibrionales bacterium]|nr:sterol desaturase family protein [Bdellovibrionales bacterium]